MSCCDNTIECQRDADMPPRIYTPKGSYSFADLTPTMRVWGASSSAASPILTIGIIQTVNGSAWSHADESLSVIIKLADLALLPDDEALYYDVTLTGVDGTIYPFDGGVFELYPDGSEGSCSSSGCTISVCLDGLTVPVIIQSGGLGIAASIELAQLNQAVVDAQAAEELAEQYRDEAQAATINKADLNGSNILGANQAAFSNQLAIVQTGTGAATRTIPNKLRDVIFVEDFGAVGNGTTDDTTAIQAALNSAAARSARGGGRVSFRPGMTYKTTAIIVLPENVTLDLNGGKLIPTFVGGDNYGIDPRSYSCVTNGEIAVAQTGTPGSQSAVGACIVVGAIYGQGGTVATPAVNQYVTGVRLSNLTLSSNKSVDNGAGKLIGAAAIQLVGGVSNITIENITVPDSAFLLAGIAGDWGSLGTLSVTATAAAQNVNKTAFNANTALTTHPANITLKNIKIGALTRVLDGQDTGSYGIRFSGCVNVTVDGAQIGSCTNAAIRVTAGDLGAEFAPVSIKPLVRKGHSFRNIAILAGSTGYGMQIDAYADNIATAVAGGYAPLYDVILTTNDEYDSITGIGSGASNASYGARFDGMRGGVCRNLNFSKYKEGINVDQYVSNMQFYGCETTLNRENGVLVEHPTYPPESVTFYDLKSFSNGQDSGYPTSSGIQIGVSRGCGSINGRFGKKGSVDSGQRFGVYIKDTATAVVLQDTRVHSVRATDGFAYLMGSGGGANTFNTTSNNTQDNAFCANIIGGQTVVAFITAKALNDGHDVPIYTAQRGQLTGGITPQFGTYTRDSLILITDAQDGQPTFAVCTGSGSPGTWRALAPAGLIQSAATTAAVNAAGVPTQAEFNAFVSAFNDLRTKLQTAKITA